MTASEVGAAWESKVTAWLKAHGHPGASRLRGREGPRDHGDIGGFHRWALDCKDHAKLRLGPWVAQAKIEARNSQKPLSAVIVRQRGRPTKDALVVMDLQTFARLETYINHLQEDHQ